MSSLCPQGFHEVNPQYVTAEQKLRRAEVDNMIMDSLKRPLDQADLPDYPTGPPKSKEYIKIRTERHRLNTEEYWRNDAQHKLMEPYMEDLYLYAYGEKIDRVRSLLRIAWQKIDADPDKADEYYSAYRVLTQYQNLELGGFDET